MLRCISHNAQHFFRYRSLRLFSVANVFNLNEPLLSNKFSKRFVPPDTPVSETNSIDDGLMINFVMQQELNRLDVDRRSLYFRVRNPDSVDWEVPKGRDLLVVYPGSWLKVFYRNNHEAPNLSAFGGVLVKIHENYHNGVFRMMGVVGGVVVAMEFMTYSPLIERIEIHRRSIPTRNMEYLWDGPISNFKGPVDSVVAEETATFVDKSTVKKKSAKGPEIISKATTHMSIEERLAALLPMEIPKGYDKIREMDEIDRYTASLCEENFPTSQLNQ